MPSQVITENRKYGYRLTEHITTPRRLWHQTLAGQAVIARREVERDAQHKLMQNKVGIGKSSNKFSGVRFVTSGSWEVMFTYANKRRYGGTYDTEELAARAHDDLVIAKGWDRPLNFEEGG